MVLIANIRFCIFSFKIIKTNQHGSKKKCNRKKANNKTGAVAKKKLTKSIPLKKTGSLISAKASKTVLKKPILVPVVKKTKVLYIDASFFFPPGNGGYTDNYQDGRYSANGMLIAPILLRVGSVMKTVTIYYKNNTTEDLTVWILKHHIDHHAYSGEVEVMYEACPPGIAAPDNFLQTVINHFDAGGKILDKYMYHIEIGTTMKTATEERLLRGIRIAYTEPA